MSFLLTLAITLAVNAVAYAITPRPNVTTRGPRLSDLRVLSSAYGKTIPILEGKYRLGANIIWSNGIEEVETKKKTGGKGGGGGQTDIQYTYFSSFALGLCEGEADQITRMWADGKLLYDKTGTAVNVLKDGVTFRFYPGSETQEPDPLIQADKGSEAPAFRGLCYMVFERVPLADFGNRVPNVTIEIDRDVDNNYTFESTGRHPTQQGSTMSVGDYGIFTSYYPDTSGIDWDRGYMYMTGSGGPDGDRGIRRFNLEDMAESKQIAQADSLSLDDDFRFNASLSVASTGHVFASTGGGNSSPVVVLDPVSLIETARFGFNDTALSNSTVNFVMTERSLINKANGVEGKQEFVMCLPTGGLISPSVGILKMPGLDYVWDSDTAGYSGISSKDDLIAGCNGSAGGTYCDFYVLTGDRYDFSEPDNFQIYRIRVSASARYELFDALNTFQGVEVEEIIDHSPADAFPGETELTGIGGFMIQDPQDGNLIFALGHVTDGTYMVKLDMLTGDYIWQTQVNRSPSSRDINNTRLNGPLLGWAYKSGSDTFGTMIHMGTGALLIDHVQWDDPTTSPASTGSGGWDGKSGSYVATTNSTSVGIARYFFDRLSITGISVGSIVRRLGERSGLVAADMDTTDIDTETVEGYAILNQTTARGAIEPLSSAYFFDGVESDWILKFVLRGQNTVRTITEAELSVMDAFKGEYFVESRIQELELPEVYGISYVDVDNDYAEGYQTSKRIKEPVNAMSSSNKLEFDFTAAVGADFARQWVERALFSSWQERDMYNFNLSWYHLDLDPTDRVTMTMDSGDQFEPRLSQLDIGANLTLELTGISEDPSSYSSSSVGYAGVGAAAQTIRSSFLTKLIFLDSPLLKDADEPLNRTSSPTYFYLGGYGGANWVGGDLYKSADGTSYNNVGRIVNEMYWGSIINVLGDPPENDIWSTDETNSIRVTLNSGEDQIAGITQLEMLNRANPAAIIKSNGEVEIIQYRDVVQESDGTFTLSGLLRARRGTDTMAFDHGVGETFLMLDSYSGDSFSLTLSELNTAVNYKAVGTGQSFDNADEDLITSIGRALMPYAPVHQTASLEVGDDIQIDWVRRTRVGGALQQGVGTVPLNEDTEEYEIDFIDPYDSSVVRTVLALTDPTYLYDAADWATDGMENHKVFVTIENPDAEINTTAGWTNLVGVMDTVPGGHSGTYTFDGGTTNCEAYQDFTIPANKYVLVDAGVIDFDLNWWQDGTSTDTARMDLEFFDADMGSLGTSAGVDDAPVGFTAKQNLATLPVGTRFVRMTMVFTEITPTHNEGKIDDITADLVGPVTLTPATLRLMVYQISAQVGRGFSREVEIDVE